MGMNIFVTGGSGFVGRHLLQKLNADSRIGTIYCLFRKMPSRLGDKVRPVIGDVLVTSPITGLTFSPWR